jgi:lysophospholipase L1-like esterase
MNELPKSIRYVTIIIGGMLLVLALFAGRLGLWSFLPAVIGLFVILTGILGNKFKNFYQATAIIVLNTALLLGLFELGARFIDRTGIVPTYKDTHIQRYLTLPYYRQQEWAINYWNEAQLAESYRYVPYIVWRHRPYEGIHININQDGIRHTPGADCRPSAFTVFTFGGSSMWGWGSPDWGTIPAYLQKGLDNIFDGPVCVVNLGEDAYVSTQGMVTLSLQLQKGNIPDAVIFYDGINDVYTAYESGMPGAHPMLDPIAIRFEESENALIGIARGSRMYWLLKRVAQMTVGSGIASNLIPITGEDENGMGNQLAPEVVENYLGTYQVVAALANEYSFEKFFFWQPHLAAGGKVFTEQEQEFRTEITPALSNLAQDVYAQIEEASIDYDKLWYIANIFDEYENQIWIDAWGHVTPEGNQIVAESMLEVIVDHLSGN